MDSVKTPITKENVKAALADLDRGVPHEFGPSVGYDLVYEGRRYAPKAVFGIAVFHASNVRIGPYDFKGGEGSYCFRALRKLGFDILPKTTRSSTSPDWTEDEVRFLVADYFEMLAKEASGLRYNKTKHREALLPKLNKRSHGSIEFKHQNVSAVLIELGLPYIAGYKPATNYQTLLWDIVQEFAGADVETIQQIEAHLDAPAQPPQYSDSVFTQALVAAPEISAKPNGTTRTSQVIRKLDYRARDEANRSLGRLGEEFVFRFERRRLITAGRPDLADNVVWLSETVGDGAGYDIESFETDGSKIYIEVKTTKLGIAFQFFLSRNEIDAAAELKDAYRLYRVFSFGPHPRLYILSGDLKTSLSLTPVLYSAGLRSTLIGLTEEGAPLPLRS